jgi:hypothetical protein
MAVENWINTPMLNQYIFAYTGWLIYPDFPYMPAELFRLREEAISETYRLKYAK